jgi:CRP-like cAMP-binding protein
MLGRWKRSSPELDRIQFLKTVPFFDRLSNRQLKSVSDMMFERTYEADETIFEEGQPGAALFLILDGKVAIEIYRETSTTRLAILEGGAFFGEMALVQRDAKTACQIFRSLAGMLSDRLRSTNELVQMKTRADTSGLG